MFDYGAGGNEDEEAGYRFGAHNLATANMYRSEIMAANSAPFQVTSVEPLRA